MQNELLALGLENVNDKIENLREIYFSLNDYSSSLNKEYYFTFNVVKSGYVKICINNAKDKIELVLNDIILQANKEFYLKKGTYQVCVRALLLENITIEISVKGYVKYHNVSNVKVLNGLDYSVISVYEKNIVTFYKYNGETIILDTINTTSFDFYLDKNEVVVFYVVDGRLYKKIFMLEIDSSIVEEIGIEDLTEIKCYNIGKVGLYGVKKGYLYEIEVKYYSMKNLNLKVKNLLACKDNCVVFRDVDNKIKLCDFSVS